MTEQSLVWYRNPVATADRILIRRLLASSSETSRNDSLELGQWIPSESGGQVDADRSENRTDVRVSKGGHGLEYCVQNLRFESDGLVEVFIGAPFGVTK